MAGGAYFNATATVKNCTFTGNETGNEGGGAYFLSTGTVINSTLYKNTAYQGGGLYVPGFPFTLQNSILLSNTATTGDHQAYVNNTDVTDVVRIQTNLIAGGADPMGTNQGVGYATPGSGNITEAGTVDESNASVVFASTDAANANYLRLKDGSPAVGAGNNDYVRNATPPITTDATGAMRIQGGTVDLGAYESAFATPTPQTLTFTSAATRLAGGRITLAATASSGLTPVTFVVTSEALPDGSAVTTAGDVATLAAGVLTLENPGTVVITATQAGGNSGGTTYAAATQTQTITVRDPAIPTIFRATEGGASRGTDGSNWTDQVMTLQAALAAAIVAGDQVWIAQGTYKPHLTRRLATFTIPAGVLVYGGFKGDDAATDDDGFDPAGGTDNRAKETDGTFTNETILSGDLAGDDGDDPTAPGYADTRDDNSNTVVYIGGPNVTLDGLTITAGDGGGVRGRAGFRNVRTKPRNQELQIHEQQCSFTWWWGFFRNSDHLDKLCV